MFVPTQKDVIEKNFFLRKILLFELVHDIFIRHDKHISICLKFFKNSLINNCYFLKRLQLSIAFSEVPDREGGFLSRDEGIPGWSLSKEKRLVPSLGMFSKSADSPHAGRARKQEHFGGHSVTFGQLQREPRQWP